MNYYQPQIPPNRPVFVRPPSPPKRYRFRWPIVYIPLLIFLTVTVVRYIADSIEPSFFSWDDIMDYCRIYRNRERIKMLVILGLVVTSFVIIVRILLPKKEEEDC